MAKLLLKFKTQLLEELPLEENCSLTIGRTTENDIVIDNLGVSRHHARIFHQDGEFMLEDIGSQNGTVVNDIAVRSCTLCNFDKISIGKHTIVFSEKGEAEPAKKKFRPLRSSRKILPPEETLQLGNKAKKIVTIKEKEASVEVLKGGSGEKKIPLKKILMLGGKSDNADIKILGECEQEVIFIISSRPTGHFISPSQGVEITVDDQIVTEVVKLKPGSIIQALETKLKFCVS